MKSSFHQTANSDNKHSDTLAKNPVLFYLKELSIAAPILVVNFISNIYGSIHSFRMFLVIILNVSSFLIISSTEADSLAIIGVVFTSLALGVGEVTLLSYSAKFNK